MATQGQQTKDPYTSAREVLALLDLDLTMPEGSGRYALYDELGRGGNAHVFFGVDRALQRKVAVKILRKRYQTEQATVAHFLNEAKIMARLDHPGIVPIYDIGFLEKGELFFAMEKVEGGTLRDLLDRRDQKGEEAPTQEQLLRIFQQVCQVVAYAHSQGVVHRDLKPDNIMVGEFDSVYVMDWGIARDLKETGRKSAVREVTGGSLDITAMLNARKVKGTPKYMSPEQALGIKDISYPSDVFSLGLILYEILVGKHPFEADNMRDLLHNIKEAPIPDFSSAFLNSEMKSICFKALEKMPQNRYPHAGPLAKDVRHSRQHRQVSVHKDHPIVRVTKLVRRHRFKSIIGLSIVAIGIFVGAHYVDEAKELEDMLTLAKQYQLKTQYLDKEIKAIQQGDYLPGHQKYYLDKAENKRCTNLVLTRVFLSRALKEQGQKMPRWAVDMLKENWMNELQYHLNKQDYASFRETFEEMKPLNKRYGEVLKWNRQQSRRIEQFSEYLSRHAQSRTLPPPHF
ncbi:MAG: serine/threonine protein kinase [Lentisphaeria bacterium]|nr:serine/threonine protein kinase [Lentisphaeria bacterium]